jgi:hypothetical protein
MTRSQTAFIRGVRQGRDDPQSFGCEYLGERGGEERVTIVDHEPQRLGAVTQVHGQVPGLLRAHAPVGCAVTPVRWSRRVPCSMNTSTYSRLSSTVSTTRKSQARIA